MWINWASKQFQMEVTKSGKLFDMPGVKMLALTPEDWRRLVPNANLNFLTHLELLRQCREVCKLLRFATPFSLSFVPT